MKFLHVSDLHVGKQLNLYDLSLLQEQVLSQIVTIAKEQEVDAILIAGDIYDKSAPSGEAFRLFDGFLNQIDRLDRRIPTFIIAGNHDSNLRLQYGKDFLKQHEIYISTTPPQKQDEFLERCVLSDEFGEVNIYMLPFTRPSDVKNLYLGDEGVTISNYHDAVSKIIERENMDYSQRNILISHQLFVAGDKAPERRDSEMKYISIGGIEQVDISCVEQFDYVALGHLHSNQQVGKKHIRYSGTPLKYSVSEAGDQKTVTIVTLGEKGEEPVISQIALKAQKDVKRLKGTLDELLGREYEPYRSDFVSITLTDETIQFASKERLAEFFDSILEIQVDNKRVNSILKNETDMEALDNPYEMFCKFYQEMNGQPISDAEREILLDVIQTVSEGGKS